MHEADRDAYAKINDVFNQMSNIPPIVETPAAPNADRILDIDHIPDDIRREISGLRLAAPVVDGFTFLGNIPELQPDIDAVIYAAAQKYGIDYDIAKTYIDTYGMAIYHEAAQATIEFDIPLRYAIASVILRNRTASIGADMIDRFVLAVANLTNSFAPSDQHIDIASLTTELSNRRNSPKRRTRRKRIK